MSNYNWSLFELRVPVKSEKVNLYNSWSTPADLESWFLQKAIFKRADGSELSMADKISVNDVYSWTWYGWPDEVAEEGRILEVNGFDHLKFIFGKAGIVDINIIEDQGENLVVLRQSGIPEDEASRINYHMGCTRGWLFYLTNLKSVLENGFDLRNKNVNLKNVITC